MKHSKTVALCALALSTSTLSGQEIVSIWNQNAQAYLSSKGKVLKANALSIDKTERFVLIPDKKNKGMVLLSDTAKRVLGQYTQETLGNSFFAFKTKDGRYLSCDKKGTVTSQAQTIGDAERFAVVPLRKGAKVAIRAYQGWEGKIHVDHPADFPTLKANVNTLQLSALLDPPHKKFFSRKVLSDYRKSFSTDKWESEYILMRDTKAIKANPAKSRLGGIVERIELMESQGYECDYMIIYREPMVKDHIPGPWSDKRILSKTDLDLIHTTIKKAHKAGRLRHPSYRLATLAYLFEHGKDRWLGLSKGLDDKVLAFIKKNFFALCMEINSHDYAKRNSAPDIAKAAAWCLKNKLDIIITSGGGTNRDVGYKKMYQTIFAEMKKLGVNPASPHIHYVLHHVFQPYENRLPEWEPDTTAENAKWLIEQVQPKLTLEKKEGKN